MPPQCRCWPRCGGPIRAGHTYPEGEMENKGEETLNEGGGGTRKEERAEKDGLGGRKYLSEKMRKKLRGGWNELKVAIPKGREGEMGEDGARVIK